MSRLSDKVKRKFVESYDISEWEIDTDTGWEDVAQLHKTVEYQEWQLILENGLTLDCADDHIVFTETMEEIFVKTLQPGDKIMTKQGPVGVRSVAKTEKYSNMFDVTVNSPNHRLYTNDILSHNTTTAVATILHYAIFNDHKTVALLANKGDAAREILSRIQLAFEELPKWLQQGVIEWNKGSVEFENGSKIIAAATSGTAIRGQSISFLYIDETAFVENWDEFFASVFPTISSGKTTKILFTSTPNGLNHFYKTCEGAREGSNGYAYIEVPWGKVPGRDEEWKRDTLEGMDGDLQKFAQEFECEFAGSSGTLISGAKLKALVIKRPLAEKDGLCQYEAPKPNHTYAMVVDVGRGKGLDYSAIQVVDVTSMPYKQVLVYRDNMSTPLDFTASVFRMAKSYNEAVALIEINDIGQQVAESLLYDFEYENILYTQNNGRAGKIISAGGKGSEIGIRTTKSVKSVGCSVLKMLIEQDQLIINDFETIQELSTFSKKANSYEAESGCHDDLVMCLVLFAWLSDQKYFRELTDINTLARLREKTEEDIEADMLPFGFIDTGHDEPDVIDEVEQRWIRF